MPRTICSKNEPTSANANLWSGLDDYTPEQWTRIQDWLDRIYEDFTNKVAQGRALPKESVLEAARGRVWSGEDAKRLSLIDELGGFREAIALAREAAGIAPDAPVRLKVFPEEKPVWQRLLERGSPSGDARVAALALGHLGELARPLLELSRRLGLASDQGVLSMEEDLLLPH